MAMILHIMTAEKFLPPFIDFVDKHFGRGEHKYVFITSEKYLYGLTPEHGVEFLHTDKDIFITLLSYMQDARKIILHGLWRDKIDQLLVQEPALLDKSYWIMWGGDFYFPETKTDFRKEVIRNVRYLVTRNDFDVSLVQESYGASGIHIECLNYTSNIFSCKKPFIPNDRGGRTNILLGNSAAETNNHFESFEILKNFGSENIHIFCPLSYGDRKYAEQVIVKGTDMFPGRFTPITEFMEIDQYLNFISTIDIAMFNHRRQQAFGNLIYLLGFGKKVYMNKCSNLNLFLSRHGIKVFDIEYFDLEPLDLDVKNSNMMAVADNFSEQSLIDDLMKIIS